MSFLKNQKGFSLIELLVAITIFAVGLLAVAGMQTTAVMGNSNAQRVSESIALGQEQIETLISLPYNHTDLDPAGNPHTLVSGNYNYSWTITTNDALTNTKTIQLDVSYSMRGTAKRARIIVAKADVI